MWVTRSVADVLIDGELSHLERSWEGLRCGSEEFSECVYSDSDRQTPPLCSIDCTRPLVQYTTGLRCDGNSRDHQLLAKFALSRDQTGGWHMTQTDNVDSYSL